MKPLGIFITACVVLAAAQAAAVAIGLALMLGLIVSLFTAPKETLAFLITMAVLGAFSEAPLPFLAVVALAMVCNLMHARIRRSSTQRAGSPRALLTPPEHHAD